MALHRPLFLLLALSALLTTTWALGKASLSGSAELDGSESAVSAEPEIPGEEDGTVTKRPLAADTQAPGGAHSGERAASRVTKRESKRGRHARSLLTLKGLQEGSLKRGSSKASQKGSASKSARGNLAHNLRGAGYASLAGEGPAKAAGVPTDHCPQVPPFHLVQALGVYQGKQ